MRTPAAHFRIWLFAVVPALVIVRGTSLSADDTEAGSSPAAWKERIDRCVGKVIDEQPVTGVIVGVLTPDGKREFYGYGWTREGGPAPTPDTIFQIGSLTKPLTALMLARMAERGDVRLDDPARLHLPNDFVIPRRGEREITLQELATHTSGLPRLPPDLMLGVLLRAIGTGGEMDPDPYGKYDEKQLAAGVKQIELTDVAKPKVSYSNLGMGLLGHALAHRAQKSYGELLQSEIADPLGMVDTAVTLSASQKTRLATGHDGNGEEVPVWTFASLPGCGAVYSTADDMLRLLETECGRTESKLAGAMRMTQEKRHPKSGGMHVGLGWLMREMDGRRVYWHNGATGGYTSYAAFCRKPTCAVVILSNSGLRVQDSGHTAGKLGAQLIQLLIEETTVIPNSQ